MSLIVELFSSVCFLWHSKRGRPRAGGAPPCVGWLVVVAGGEFGREGNRAFYGFDAAAGVLGSDFRTLIQLPHRRYQPLLMTVITQPINVRVA